MPAGPLLINRGDNYSPRLLMIWVLLSKSRRSDFCADMQDNRSPLAMKFPLSWRQVKNHLLSLWGLRLRSIEAKYFQVFDSSRYQSADYYQANLIWFLRPWRWQMRCWRYYPSLYRKEPSKMVVCGDAKTFINAGIRELISYRVNPLFFIGLAMSWVLLWLLSMEGCLDSLPQEPLIQGQADITLIIMSFVTNLQTRSDSSAIGDEVKMVHHALVNQCILRLLTSLRYAWFRGWFLSLLDCHF